jgi:hypothetical protein
LKKSQWGRRQDTHRPRARNSWAHTRFGVQGSFSRVGAPSFGDGGEDFGKENEHEFHTTERA